MPTSLVDWSNQQTNIQTSYIDGTKKKKEHPYANNVALFLHETYNQ